MQKSVNLVDLVKSSHASIYYLVLTCKIGFDTAENEPLKVWGRFGDSIHFFIRLLGQAAAPRPPLEVRLHHRELRHAQGGARQREGGLGKCEVRLRLLK